MSNHDLDIGVIYTHERDYLPRLLSSLDPSRGALDVRLLLVDNQSPDGAEQWTELFAPTIILRNGRRLTYAENLNRVLAASKARYVLLLNTDMYFEPREKCLAKMVAFMDHYPECGVAGCRLLHKDGAEAFAARRFQTPAVIAARRLGLARWMPATIDEYLYRQQGPQAVFACDWLSGCFLLVRREAFQQIGGFDTGFRKYFEDVDFCLRMQLAGWRVMYNGRTSGYHLEQRGSGRWLSADAWRHARSYLRWLHKWGLRTPRTTAANPRRRAA